MLNQLKVKVIRALINGAITQREADRLMAIRAPVDFIMACSKFGINVEVSDET